MHVDFVPTSKGQKVCTFFLGFPGATTTVMFSHGNAADLGTMRNHLRALGHILKVNMYAYDYSGYGCSTGKPSVSNVYADSEAAYDNLLKKYHKKGDPLFLYGQSLGSGPSIHLAKMHSPSGVILHGGIMSGLRVIRPVDSTMWYDIFPNIDAITQVKCPVFVVHGTEDQEVPIHHGLGLSDAAPVSFKPWLVQGGGHNDIEFLYRMELMDKLSEFITTVVKGSNSKGSGTMQRDGAPSVTFY